MITYFKVLLQTPFKVGYSVTMASDGKKHGKSYRKVISILLILTE